MYLGGVHLMDVHISLVSLSYGRAFWGHTSHRRTSHRRLSHERASLMASRVGLSRGYVSACAPKPVSSASTQKPPSKSLCPLTPP
jgi:hypothetical protein